MLSGETIRLTAQQVVGRPLMLPDTTEVYVQRSRRQERLVYGKATDYRLHRLASGSGLRLLSAARGPIVTWSQDGRVTTNAAAAAPAAPCDALPQFAYDRARVYTERVPALVCDLRTGEHMTLPTSTDPEFRRLYSVAHAAGPWLLLIASQGPETTLLRVNLDAGTTESVAGHGPKDSFAALDMNGTGTVALVGASSVQTGAFVFRGVPGGAGQTLYATGTGPNQADLDVARLGSRPTGRSTGA